MRYSQSLEAEVEGFFARKAKDEMKKAQANQGR